VAGDDLAGCPGRGAPVRIARAIVRARGIRGAHRRAEPRRLAAIHAVTTNQRLSTDIPLLVGKIWPVLREQGARTGHNVVIYRGSPATTPRWPRPTPPWSSGGPATGAAQPGVSWEVYGDWDDDPAKVRTDIYFLLRPATG